MATELALSDIKDGAGIRYDAKASAKAVSFIREHRLESPSRQ
jgi:hypothetical protein